MLGADGPHPALSGPHQVAPSHTLTHSGSIGGGVSVEQFLHEIDAIASDCRLYCQGYKMLSNKYSNNWDIFIVNGAITGR